MKKTVGQRPRILIVGGGFAGIRLAQRLARFRVSAEIFLVNRETYQTYTPSLYEVVCGRHPRLVCFSIPDALAGTGVVFHQGTVDKIEFKHQTVTLADGISFDYDHLVLALGMVTNDYGIGGVHDYAFPLKTAQDAWLLRQHIESEYVAAQGRPTAEARRKLRFVIAGGGPTGLELAAGLAEFRRHLSRDFGIPLSTTRIEICEAGPELLGGKDPRLISLVRRRLDQLGVKLLTSSPILKDEVKTVVIGKHHEATETLIWTAGVKVPKLIEELRGVERQHDGRLLVDGHLRAIGRKNVWVVGDVAGTPDAGTAQIALRHADLVAENLRRQLAGLPLAHYEPGTAILVMPLGARFAIVRLGNVILRGWAGMLVRYLADLRYLLSLFPLSEALSIWFVRHRPCPDCRLRLARLIGLEQSQSTDRQNWRR